MRLGWTSGMGRLSKVGVHLRACRLACLVASNPDPTARARPSFTPDRGGASEGSQAERDPGQEARSFGAWQKMR